MSRLEVVALLLSHIWKDLAGQAYFKPALFLFETFQIAWGLGKEER